MIPTHLKTTDTVGILQNSGEASRLADKENNKVTLLLDTLCFVIRYFLYISLATDRADPYRVGPFLGSTYPVHSLATSRQTVSNAFSHCLLNSHRHYGRNIHGSHG